MNIRTRQARRSAAWIGFVALVAACATGPATTPTPDVRPTVATGTTPPPTGSSSPSVPPPTSAAPSPSPAASSRDPIAPPGSIITADVEGEDGAYRARLRAWTVDGTLLATFEAPFEVPGWHAASTVAATPDGRLAIYVSEFGPDTGLMSADGVAVIDVAGGTDGSVPVYAGEHGPTWTTAGDLVTETTEGPESGTLYRLRREGVGPPLEMRDAETDGMRLQGVSDRPDAAVIEADLSLRHWRLRTWDGVVIPTDLPPPPVLVTGVERDYSVSGDAAFCEEGDAGPATCHVVWATADRMEFETGLAGDRSTGWFGVAWTRRGDAALATNRDRVRLLTMGDDGVDVELLARLPDVGAGDRWGIAASTDGHVVLRDRDSDRTAIVPLAGGEPVWIQGDPVLVVPG